MIFKLDIDVLYLMAVDLGEVAWTTEYPFLEEVDDEEVF